MSNQPKEIRTINPTPSWQSMVGLLVTLIENGDAEGRRTAIEELTDRAEDARFFPWAIGTSAPTYFLQNIREDMKVRGYNIDDVVLHTLRHTCATRLAEGGMDLVGLRDWLGHSDINVTAERYIHLMNSHVHRGVAILDAYGSGTIGAANRKRMESSGQFSNGEARLGGSNRDMHGTTSH